MVKYSPMIDGGETEANGWERRRMDDGGGGDMYFGGRTVHVFRARVC